MSARNRIVDTAEGTFHLVDLSDPPLSAHTVLDPLNWPRRRYAIYDAEGHYRGWVCRVLGSATPRWQAHHTPLADGNWGPGGILDAPSIFDAVEALAAQRRLGEQHESWLLGGCG